MPFVPRYEISPEVAKSLMRIEAAKVMVENLPVKADLTPMILAILTN